MIPTKVTLVVILVATSLADACWPRSERKVVIVQVQEPDLTSSEQQRKLREETGSNVQPVDGIQGPIEPEQPREQPAAPRERPAATLGKSCFFGSECGNGQRCDDVKRVCVDSSLVMCENAWECFPHGFCLNGVCR